MKTLILLTFFSFLLPSCTVDVPTYDYDLQGHRGARGLAPENTIPSFLKAVDHGADTMELDVVVTADGNLLVSHEPWFNHHISTKPDGTPVTEEEEMELNIYEMTIEEIKLFDVGKRGHPDFPEQQSMAVTKPLLREVVQSVDGYVESQGLEPVHYNIETKSKPEWYGVFTPEPGEQSRLLYEEIKDLQILDRATVQSFDPATLIALNEMDGSVRQAMLVFRKDQTVERMVEILGYEPDIWSPEYQLVTPGLIEEVHTRGMDIVPWTINKRDQMIRLLEMGVDGIITDYPNRAPTALNL
ncbi:MAG: glycerophosphodiester phosphodiesterase [Bacteroidetes bacterium]|jgi:glycerophosphoryl diester phosphodiesterase|nr:glycerophosphodiester phosphodiesterase [Bacteroidota bacterium]